MPIRITIAATKSSLRDAQTESILSGCPGQPLRKYLTLAAKCGSIKRIRRELLIKVGWLTEKVP